MSIVVATVEPLLNCPEHRVTMFPIEHPDLYAFGVRASRAFWIAQTVKLGKDARQWKTMPTVLTPAVKEFVLNTMAFFAGSESEVINTLVHRLHALVELPEAKHFYGLQIGVETVHAEQYNLIIDALVESAEERTRIFRSVRDVPCIRDKSKWTRKYLEQDNISIGTRLLALCCVEQIFFSASFASIYWVKTKLRVLPGLTLANEYISRDEGLHCEFAVYLLNNYVTEVMDDVVVQDMVRDAVEIEKRFVRDTLKGEMVGINSDLLCQYVDFIGDKLLRDLHRPPIFGNTANPFPFMEHMSSPYKASFFERMVTDYKKGEADVKEDTWDGTDIEV